MFTPGRYIVIDDDVDELRVLVETLHSLDAPCVGIHFIGQMPDPARFTGVRVLFSDLHLIAGGNKKLQFSNIEALLRTCVNPAQSGPYVLVLWTSHADEAGELSDYLEARLAAAKRPLAVLGLDKKLYLDGAKLAKPEDLRAHIADRIKDSPQLRALISWEADVLAAAGATLAEVTDLVPDDDRTLSKFNSGLDGVLSQLAVAAVGSKNVGSDPKAAINAALTPILADRIFNAPPGDEDIWAAAMTRLASKDLPTLSSAQAGHMNRLLHLSLPTQEALKPTDWGVVLKVPDVAREDGAASSVFGMTFKDILNTVFQVETADHEKCTPVVVRTGAICDHAQQKKGPLPFVLGLLVPYGTVRRKQERLKSELECPTFVIESRDGPRTLFVNGRFEISMVAPSEAWTPLFRIRETLLTMIAAHVAAYTTRPGIIELRPPKLDDGAPSVKP